MGSILPPPRAQLGRAICGQSALSTLGVCALAPIGNATLVGRILGNLDAITHCRYSLPAHLVARAAICGIHARDADTPVQQCRCVVGQRIDDAAMAGFAHCFLQTAGAGGLARAPLDCVWAIVVIAPPSGVVCSIADSMGLVACAAGNRCAGVQLFYHLVVAMDCASRASTANDALTRVMAGRQRDVDTLPATVSPCANIGVFLPTRGTDGSSSNECGVVGSAGNDDLQLRRKQMKAHWRSLLTENEFRFLLSEKRNWPKLLETLQYSPHALQYWQRRFGIRFKSGRPRTALTKAQWLMWAASPLTLNAVGKKVGVSPRTVSNHFKRLGIDPRQRRKASAPTSNL